MDGLGDLVTQSLLDDWQRDFPITPRPYAEMAKGLGVSESEVLARLAQEQEKGRITRVGATCAPNIISASTLAAVAAPDDRIEDVARIIGEQPGVNHSYLRENDWNLWFVATGPDRDHVNATLDRISRLSGLRVLDLRLIRPFNIDLGFSLRGTGGAMPKARLADASVFRDGDRDILQYLMQGLPLCQNPYADLGAQLGLDEATVLARVDALCTAGIITRLGVIVRHRALGWRANAMVVWNIDHDAITRAGPALAAQPGITLCYEREPVDGVWPYRLYSMIHARSRSDALDTLAKVSKLPELRDAPRVPLFSLRCFRQTGATVGLLRKDSA